MYFSLLGVLGIIGHNCCQNVTVAGFFIHRQLKSYSRQLHFQAEQVSKESTGHDSLHRSSQDWCRFPKQCAEALVTWLMTDDYLEPLFNMQ